MAGGNVGEKGSWSEEYQVFTKSEEVLLFLYKNEKKIIITGKYAVFRENYL